MKRIRSWWFSVMLVTLLFPGATPTRAQEGLPQQPIRFERIKVEDGLPHSTVLSVLQDQQGFMWFATADGLSRYDGMNFTNFQHERYNPNSLSNNNTFALIESSDGLIWVGTDPGGLNVYNPNTGNFTLYLHAENDPNSLPDDSIWSLLEDRNGNIWIGTRNGLSRLDRESGLFTNYLPDADDPRSLAAPVVYRIYEDSEGTIWIGGNQGLQRYEPETDDFTTFTNDPDDETSLTSKNVWSMLEDSKGNFWVGTRRAGLNLFDRETGKVIQRFYHDEKNPTTLSDDNIWNLFEDSDDYLWILTEYGGLNRYDPVSGNFYAYQSNPNDPSTLSNNDVFWMAEDRSGVLWITSRYGGVNKLYPSLSQFGLYRSVPGNENSLNSNEIYSVLAEKNGTIWIGTFGGGINRFDRETGKMTVYMNDPEDPNSISNDKIYYIQKAEDGTLWLATYGGGLNHLDPETGKNTIYTDTPETPYGLSIKYATTMENAENGRLWIGTLGFGMLLFNPENATIEKEYATDPEDPNSLSEGTVYDLAIDSSGKVWIATARGGLELLDPKTDRITHHLNDPDDDNTILNNTVHALYWDADHQIMWAATAGGLSGYDIFTGNWLNYEKSDGLPSDTIVGIQPGTGSDLWVSTTKGISRFERETETFYNYVAQDGLQGDQFQIACSRLGPDGEIFFGGSNGLTFFHPEELRRNLHLPPVVFTDFFLDNVPVPVGSEILPFPIEKTSEITLSHEQDVFSIRFAALSYQLSEKNLYRYKLEGFDDDWSPPSNSNGARYTNLSPGKYTFLVKAANNDGTWNPIEARLYIHILPPWWQTVWFRVLLVLGFVGLVLAFIRFRLESVRRLNQELERRVIQRTEELQNTQHNLYQAKNSLEMQLKEVNSLQVKLKEQAIRDVLTGLYNRRYLNDILEKEISRARRQGSSLVFMLLDLDRFKHVNDTYGHAGGDQALIALGELLHNHTRTSDYAFRYGGEEFMVLLTDITLEDALNRAEDLRVAVQALRITHERRPIPLTTSIGLATYPLHGKTADEMLLVVDDALYRAKHLGRDCVVTYDSNK